ncbi:hypothetical protein NEMIN01_1752 [Nematocida minor]|uniref:uncharacterized protein n=1 Tax=Nematocida minor TaxID=1912983 RepID=UPI00222108BE|nr:uncharacterized protein NEMIN01_1752 [Nematocida minor]KAI5191968.1 hypothetical protein NEMIN01_1752 [Nematocida minor]
MILQQTLKHIAIGFIALAYFQRAACADLLEDLQNIKKYLNNKKDCIEIGIEIRSDFIDRLKASCTDNKLLYDFFNNGIKEGKEKLEKVQEASDALYDGIQPMVGEIENLDELKYSSKFSEKVKGLHKQMMEDSLPVGLDMSNSVSKCMQKFDSHMLELISQYNEVFNGKRRVEDLALFKLAKKNKPLAASIIYSLFRTKPYETDKELKDALDYIYTKMENHVFSSNLKSYSEAIKRDAEKNKLDVLKFADRHLHILFHTSGGSADEVAIYLDLINKKLSSEEVWKYIRTIIPAQVIKIIMMEYEINMNGGLMDYKKNLLFSNLGRIIHIVAKDSEVTKKMPGKTQSDILDLLTLLWSKYGVEEARMQHARSDMELLKHYNIKEDDFLSMQRGFMSTSWMFDISGSAQHNVHDDKNKVEKLFDICYTHPMLYLYKRCESISKEAKKKKQSNEKPFMEEDSNGISMLRLYKISSKDSDEVWVQNIKSCIKAWFSQYTKIIYKREDGQDYEIVANSFVIYLEKSVYFARGRAVTSPE